MFNIELYDGSSFQLRLPHFQKDIGVLVSGGLDSALLYYLIKRLSTDHSVTPYTLLRDDGSQNSAQNVINHVHDTLGIERQETNYVPITHPDSNSQVSEGTECLIKNTNKVLMVGLIQTMSEHAIHGVPKPFIPQDTLRVRYPFRNLNKTHIVDLIEKLEITSLYGLTHSCVYAIQCNECNRCRERQWAFQQMNLMHG